MPQLLLYTDGSSSQKYSVGAGAIALYVEGDETPVQESSFVIHGDNTDPGSMELLALAAGLELVPVGARVTVSCDSASVIKVSRSVLTRGGPGNPGLPVRCRDVWRRVQRAAAERDVTFVWVRGHKNNERHNRVDRTARARMHQAVAELERDASCTPAPEPNSVADAEDARRLERPLPVTPDSGCDMDEEGSVHWAVIGTALVLAIASASLVFFTGWHANVALLVVGVSVTVLLACAIAVLWLLAPAQQRPAVLRAIVTTMRGDFKDIACWLCRVR